MKTIILAVLLLAVVAFINKHPDQAADTAAHLWNGISHVVEGVASAGSKLAAKL